MNAQNRRNLFRDNIKRLMMDRGVTPRQLALECDLSPKWVRRACEGGLDRLYVRNEDKLTRLAAFLGLSHPREFWRESPFTDLPTDIRDRWKELAGSPFEKLAKKELEACRDACRDLVQCRKVYDLLRGMPEGQEFSEMYLKKLANKEERSFHRSIEDEADYQHGRLSEQREQNNLTSLIDLVRQMQDGEAVAKEIQRDLDEDENRWLVPYARGSRTMREFWIKVIDIHSEGYAADWLYQSYLLPCFVSHLREMGEVTVAEEVEEITERGDLLNDIREVGVQEAARRLCKSIRQKAENSTESGPSKTLGDIVRERKQSRT